MWNWFLACTLTAIVSGIAQLVTQNWVERGIAGPWASEVALVALVVFGVATAATAIVMLAMTVLVVRDRWC